MTELVLRIRLSNDSAWGGGGDYNLVFISNTFKIRKKEK